MLASMKYCSSQSHESTKQVTETFNYILNNKHAITAVPFFMMDGMLHSGNFTKV